MTWAGVRESLVKSVLSAGYMVVQQPDANGIVYRYRFENANYTKARVMRETPTISTWFCWNRYSTRIKQ